MFEKGLEKDEIDSAIFVTLLVDPVQALSKIRWISVKFCSVMSKLIWLVLKLFMDFDEAGNQHRKP